MKALTIDQPWAWSVLQGFKTVESRGWPPPDEVVGATIVIHAGPTLHAQAIEWLEKRLGAKVPLRLPAGAVIATATLAGWFRAPPGGPVQELGGRVTREECDALAASEWFTGPYGFVLRDVLPYPPSPCAGQPRFWDLEPELDECVQGWLALDQPARAEIWAELAKAESEET